MLKKKTLGRLIAVLCALAMLLSTISLSLAEDEQGAAYEIINGDFETGDLTGWTILTEGWTTDPGQGVISADTYWDEGMPYNQGGNYHLDGWNTGIPENGTWQIQSSVFTLGGSGFISVRMGGNSAAVRVFKAADDEQIGYYKATRFNDTGFPSLKNGGSWADMGTYLIDLSEHLGEELYIRLCDEKVSSWAQAFFDEVVTYYETAPDVNAMFDTVKDGGSDEMIELPWTMAENAEETKQEVIIIVEVDTYYVPEAPNKYSVINGDFETGTLAGWKVVRGSFSKNKFGHENGVISANTYWNEGMPYNQGGKYHLDGWNTGIDENDTWAIQSSTFELGGSGTISLRMGGNAAAVRVYKADGTLIGYYKQTRFNDANFPSVGAGGSWADMGTYVIDLSEYLGEQLYIELCDEEANGWAQAFFDEVVTYYEEAPDYENLADTVADGGSGEEIEIPWRPADNLLDPEEPEEPVDPEEPEDPEEPQNNYSIENGGFETGDLSGWTILSDGWTTDPNQGVISASTYWGEGMPYNQAGNYHLDGWNTGIPEGETWEIRSSEFELGGSGWISVRMGGHAAAVHVFLSDGTEIGYYRESRFNDANFPHLAEGGSWADMGTYVMDLTAYIGMQLYIELCDEAVDGWAQAFFDEVVTYYEEAPDYENMSDTVADGGTGEPVEIPWTLAENLLEEPNEGDEKTAPESEPEPESEAETEEAEEIVEPEESEAEPEAEEPVDAPEAEEDDHD